LRYLILLQLFYSNKSYNVAQKTQYIHSNSLHHKINTNHLPYLL
jgi:hypothetical protein